MAAADNRPSLGARRLCLILLSLGIVAFGAYFRCANLGWKVFWFDEAWNSMLVSGRWYGELRETVFGNREIGREELQQCQRLHPGRGPVWTLQAMAAGEAQHPPLYYFLLRLWAGLLGDSVVVFRAFSVVAGLAAIPLGYWLGVELFGSRRAGWLAAQGLCVAASTLDLRVRPLRFPTAVFRYFRAVTSTSGPNAADGFVLSYLVHPEVRFLYVLDPKVPNIAEDRKEVFAFNPSASLREGLERRGWRWERASVTQYLWRLTR